MNPPASSTPVGSIVRLSPPASSPRPRALARRTALVAIVMTGTALAAPTKPARTPSSAAAAVVMPAMAPAALAPYTSEAAAPNAGQKSTGCGYVMKDVYQDATLAGWGPLSSGGSSTDLRPTSCKLPPTNNAQAQKIRASLVADGYAVDATDTIVVGAGAAWTKTTSNDGTVGRALEYRWYSKKHELTFTKCGDSGSVCEASGSRGARALNLQSFRLDEAKKAKKEGLATCGPAAREAVAIARGLPKFRESLRAKDEWASGLTYRTRYDGSIGEEALFKKVAARSKEAAALFKACTGQDLGATTEAEENVFIPKA